MDFSEAGLELITNKAKFAIDSHISDMKINNILDLSKKVCEIPSISESKKNREDFLSKMNDPAAIPGASSYAYDILRAPYLDTDLPSDIGQSLKTFFRAEISRICDVRDAVLKRVSSPDVLKEIHENFASFSESLSKTLCSCQEALFRLENGSDSFKIGDIQYEIATSFVQRQRTAFLRSLTSIIQMFPITNRQKIFENAFSLIKKCHQMDLKRTQTPLLMRDEKSIDIEISKLAHSFGLSEDVNSNDGQKFFYIAQLLYHESFEKLTYHKFPSRSLDVSDPSLNPDLTSLMQDYIISDIPLDIGLSTIINQLLAFDENSYNNVVGGFVESYNSLVGNIVRKEIVKPIIPEHKLKSLMCLKFVNMKSRANQILSILNYFEYIRCFMENKACLKVKNSNQMHCLYEISENNGPFLFEKAIQHFNSVKSHIVSIGSVFVSRLESIQVDQNPEQIFVVDRQSVIEELLELEVNFLLAKKQLVEPLLECLEHSNDKHIKQLIVDILFERPLINFANYKNYHSPYTVSIRLIEEKAKLLRVLLDLQIIHERHVSSSVIGSVPLFDSSCHIDCGQIQKRTFVDGVFVSPFEVYPSLALIPSILKTIGNVSLEFIESYDIKKSKYGSYFEIAISLEIHDLFKKLSESGLWPFDRSAFSFHFPLSNTVHSLFYSKYVCQISPLEQMITNMKEERRLRFMLSMRRFLFLSWRLQIGIQRTDLLQNAYYEQCKINGNSEKSVLMNPFKKSMNSDVIDLEPNSMKENIIDFALTEFEDISLDFTSESSIKDIIYAADFSVLKRLIQFQKLQNSILEIAVRYNNYIIDSDFMVNYFNLNDQNSDLFVTGVDPEIDDNISETLLNHYIASQVFYSSTTILRDNAMASMNKKNFVLSISSIKSKSRTILSAHAKQKKLGDSELLDLYRNEMVDSFAPFAYRIEISRVCNLERQILQSNAYIDTYIIGPELNTSLITETGHFQSFFYVPTWVETFQYLQSAPHARQGMVLKSLLQYLFSRLRVLCIVRHECSLNQRLTQVFSSIYNQSFKMDSLVFYNILQEFKSLPNSQEVEISAKFMADNEKYLFYRHEYSVLHGIESFYHQNSIESASLNDYQYGEKLKALWKSMHHQYHPGINLIHDRRYIPKWTELFAHLCHESDRSDLHTLLSMTDSYLKEALVGVESNQMLPSKIDFLCLLITQYHMKFTYMLLLNRTPSKDIDIFSSIDLMNQDVYINGIKVWNDSIVEKAILHLVPKDDGYSRFTKPIPEPKLAQAIFDVVRNQVEIILLSYQIDYLNKAIDTISNSSNGMTQKNVHDDFESIQSINIAFNNEIFYALESFVSSLSNHFNSCSELSNVVDSVISYQSQKLHQYIQQLSSRMDCFFSDSLMRIIQKWKFLINTSVTKLSKKQSDLQIIAIVSNMATQRFSHQTEAEITLRFRSQYLQLNSLKEKNRLFIESRLAQEEQIEFLTKNEFERLKDDLKQQIFVKKNQYQNVKRSVFEKVFKKITIAKSITLNIEKGSTKSSENQKITDIEHESILEKIIRENGELQKHITQMRIIKPLTEIAVTRRMKKLLVAYENERIKENEELWKKKVLTEQHHTLLSSQLYNVHIKLSSTESEIDSLKLQLENERMSNIQLVHWKAKNLKMIDELNRKISQFENSSYDVDKLVMKLENAQQELDELRAQTEYLEQCVDDTIRRPMSQIDEIKEKMIETRVAKAAMYREHTNPRFELSLDMKESFVQKLSEENIQLRLKNEELQNKISDLEKEKQKRSSSTRDFMESVPQSRAVSKLKTTSQKSPKSGTIIRPSIPSRSVSRI